MDYLSGSLYAIAVVSAWRGITVIEDVYFRKENHPIQSAFMSLGLATLILIYKHSDIERLFKPATSK
jgi:hypothetical protein